MVRMSKNAIFDVMHKTTVTFLMGLTVAGMAYSAFRGYHYFTVVRPIQQQQKQLLKEEQMAAQQIEREAELARQQREAETISA